MKRKIIWLTVSSLMGLSLLVTACAPKVEEAAPVVPAAPAAPAAPTVPAAPTAPAAPAKEMVKLTLTKLDGTKIEKMVEKPRYGGTLRWFTTEPFRGFDPFRAPYHYVEAGRLYMDALAVGDWTRSSAGTGEAAFWTALNQPPAFYIGALAESWEVVDPQTIVYRLRKGVKFQDKTPRGSWSGREVTADDVVFSIKLAYADRITTAYGGLDTSFHPVSVEARDKYTVVVKSAPGKNIVVTHNKTLAGAVYVVPRDFYEKYKNMTDWRNAMGTGPFILVDFVPASVAVLERNPDYWKKDPLFPENQLPYVDRVEWFIIPDKSTYIAALRAGKVDTGELDTYEDLQGLLKTRRDMQWLKRPVHSVGVLKLQMDKPELPQYDIRVRRALSMAIDRQAIIKDFFKGYADILSYPIIPYPEFVATGLYTPLEELPKSVQEIFSYNPAKVKQLLAEAGYPKGFKTSVDILVKWVDYMSVIKEYFAAIGVDMAIKVRDPGVMSSMALSYTFEHMDYGQAVGAQDFATFWELKTGMRHNRGKVSDPYIDDLAAQIADLGHDQAAQYKLYKEKVTPYVLEQVYNIVLPHPDLFEVRQPWLRNKDGGELHVGVWQGNNWPTYVWLDQEQKKAMGY